MSAAALLITSHGRGSAGCLQVISCNTPPSGEQCCDGGASPWCLSRVKQSQAMPVHEWKLQVGQKRYTASNHISLTSGLKKRKHKCTQLLLTFIVYFFFSLALSFLSASTLSYSCKHWKVELDWIECVITLPDVNASFTTGLQPHRLLSEKNGWQHHAAAGGGHDGNLWLLSAEWKNVYRHSWCIGVTKD